MFAGVRRGVRDTRIGARSLNKRALLLIKTGIFFFGNGFWGGFFACKGLSKRDGFSMKKNI